MNKFMQVAIEQARFGVKNGHGGPFGAVIVKDGKIIGKGHNQVVAKSDPTCHGEIAAIQDACKNVKSFDLSGADIYTTGEPCPMCLCAILWANINKIYYGCTIAENQLIGFRDEQFYDLLSLSTNKLKNRLVQVDHDECFEVFKEYNAKKDATRY